MRIVCSWCGVVMQEGGPGLVSHGICRACADVLEPPPARIARLTDSKPERKQWT